MCRIARRGVNQIENEAFDFFCISESSLRPLLRPFFSKFLESDPPLFLLSIFAHFQAEPILDNPANEFSGALGSGQLEPS